MNISLTLPGIALTILVVVVVVVLVRRLLSDSTKATTQEEEAQLIQDLFHGLQRLEERVEALETLLLDRERSEARTKTKDR